MADYLVETFDTDLAYDENTAYGNSNAGVNKVVSLGTGGKVVLGANNATIVGTLIEVRRNKTCSVKVFALRAKVNVSATAGAIVPGNQLVCAGDGEVKPAGTATNGRCIAKQASANTTAGTIDVVLI